MPAKFLYGMREFPFKRRPQANKVADDDEAVVVEAYPLDRGREHGQRVSTALDFQYFL
jgi:hypothetical protein